MEQLKGAAKNIRRCSLYIKKSRWPLPNKMVGTHGKFEICSFEFSEEKYSGHKGNLMRDLRFHYYAKHFKNSIDEELKGSKSQCPFENCLYR